MWVLGHSRIPGNEKPKELVSGGSKETFLGPEPVISDCSGLMNCLTKIRDGGKPTKELDRLT